MSRTLLFECSPRRPSDGAVVLQRYCAKARGPANFLGVQWEPVVDAPPSFESGIGFDGRVFGASPTPQVGEMVFALNDRTRAAAGLVWKNAAIVLKAAPWPVGQGNPADGDFSTIWTGAADAIVAAGGVARVTMMDGGQALRVPLIATKFGSSGDALLDSANAVKDRAAGAVVPMAWGRLLSIPGLIVDRANGIWLFSGRAATAVTGFYDGGAAFTLGVARASLAALQANVPAPGAVDYCLDAGGNFLARPWDTPTFPFTCAATFGNVKAADIASAMVTGRTALTFAAGTVAALNTLQGADNGLYVDDERTVADALDQLLLGIGVAWRLNAAGTIDLRRLDFGTPALIVPAHRRAAPERQRIIVPTGRRTLGYAPNDKVHSESEIAGILLADTIAYADGTPVETLKPAIPGATRNVARGAWAGATTYAVGDVVTYNGSSFTATAAHTSVGGTPPPNASFAVLATAGANGLTISALAPLVVGCTAGGTPKSGQLPKANQLAIFSGTTDVTAGCTFALGTAVGGTITVSSGGAISLTNITADTGVVPITVTYGGLSAIVEQRFSKSRDGAAGNSTAFVVGAPPTTSYTVIGTSIDTFIAASAAYSVNASVAWTTSSGTNTTSIFAEWSADAGATWNALAVNSGTSNAGSGFAGAINMVEAIPTAGPGRSVRVRLWGKRGTTAYSGFTADDCYVGP